MTAEIKEDLFIVRLSFTNILGEKKKLYCGCTKEKGTHYPTNPTLGFTEMDQDAWRTPKNNALGIAAHSARCPKCKYYYQTKK